MNNYNQPKVRGIEMNTPLYKRVLLKLSGEALANKDGGILDFKFIERIADVLLECKKAGVEIAVVVGAGNIWRGAKNNSFNRARADHMGMLATTINALGLEDVFAAKGLDPVVMTSVEMEAFADFYNVRHAKKALEDGKLLILGGGLGSPYFSTDTAASLRAAEIEADAILMAKNIDALYDSDPRTNPGAQKISDITYDEIINRGLRAFDLSAVLFCKENNIESYAFGLSDPDNIYRAVMGEATGTRMHN